MARCHVGTSGWQYDHWRGPFYPEHLPAEEMLRYYARHFEVVEVNNTFYKLPDAGAVARWRAATPRRFRFCCKASRYLTHMKKLTDRGAGLRKFFDAVAPLGDKLGPILFQLPGRFRVDPGRLRAFLHALPSGHRYAFEFRDPSWLCREVRTLLEEHGAALCLYEFEGWRSPVQVTAPFVYVRLHGPGAAYRGRYDGRTLQGWARRYRTWRASGLEVFFFFDNDEAGHAPRDALRLRAMLEGQNRAAGRTAPRCSRDASLRR